MLAMSANQALSSTYYQKNSTHLLRQYGMCWLGNHITFQAFCESTMKLEGLGEGMTVLEVIQEKVGVNLEI